MLKASKTFDVRFSEVDAMNVVWHGNYALYFEDGREVFGQKYGLDYMTVFNNGYFMPLVELNIRYKKPILYGMHLIVDIIYRFTQAAKIVFDYEIRNLADGTVMATAHSVQVFTDRNNNLMWDRPAFYRHWQEEMKKKYCA